MESKGGNGSDGYVNGYPKDIKRDGVERKNRDRNRSINRRAG